MSTFDHIAPKTYRADIDGLRAIAVIAVVLGHGFEDWFPRGYLGVDVFFVISGFVITHSLFGRSDARFGSFWAAFSLRRIKRLLPALLVCVCVTCLVLLFLDPEPRQSLLTGAAGLFGLSNFTLYAQELDYFSQSIRYNAFTHTWSLSVEEQFYLLFPFLFWLIYRPAKTGNQSLFLTVILGLSVISVMGFLLLQSTNPMVSYYMMPLRFWELGLGVAAATILNNSKSGFADAETYALPAILILALILVFIVPIGPDPFGHVMVVILTTALLLIGANTNKQSRFLINRPTRYIGNISYSFYLWHWPFLTFGLLAPYSLLGNPFIAVLCGFLVAVLSYHFVEQPFRRIETPSPNWKHFATAFSAIFAVIIGVYAANDFRKSQPRPPFELALRPAFLPLPISGLPYNPTCVVDGQERLLQDNTFELCTLPPTGQGDQRTLWVMGSSHAGHLQGALLKLRDDYGYGIHLVETPGVPFPVVHSAGFAARAELFENVKDNWKPGDVVILSRLYLQRKLPLELLPNVHAWLELVESLAVDLAKDDIKLLLIGPPPMFFFDDLRACNPVDVTSCSVDRETLKITIDEVHKAMSELAGRHENTELFKIFPVLCPSNTPICSPTKQGVFQFRDSDHLNASGAALAAPDMHEALLALKH